MAASKSVLITDLDNTLWDWVNVWYQSFSALLREVHEISGVPISTLENEIRTVHQRHGTSEYAFLLEELPSLRRDHAPDEIPSVYASAIEAFRGARSEELRLYPGVWSTLSTLADRGTVLVAYTESMAFYTNYRLRKTKLDGLFDFLYSPADHDLPRALTREQVRRYPSSHYELGKAVHRHTPPGELKPNPAVLLDIMAEIGATAEECVYVGDSRMKDIPMAQDAGVADVLAAYGQAQHREQYELLKRVTHWTDADVRREQEILSRGEVGPSHVLSETYAELLTLFAFVPHG